MAQTTITPRERVLTALRHEVPNQVPVDFLATPEIWDKLIAYFNLDADDSGLPAYFDPAREAILRQLEVDCRVISYDQFCAPPKSILHEGAVVNWWDSLARSTPNRMWRQVLPDGSNYDIWGHHMRLIEYESGAYEEYTEWPLKSASSVEELKSHPWPEPDWWDFSPVPDVLNQLEGYHIRFRIGSVFEAAWQLRGMEEFMMDLALNPEIPLYIMERLTAVHVENTCRVLEMANGRIDMVYFYDDVATQQSLLISKKMWEKYVRPFHQQLIDVAKSSNTPVMYHCDGALTPLIPDLIEMGIDLLNPVQPDAKGMDPEVLKSSFGDRLSFHGGIDIIKTLPRGTTEDVINEVKERIRVLGKDGGYILASSHHIQPDTPLENILSMYDLNNRR